MVARKINQTTYRGGRAECIPTSMPLPPAPAAPRGKKETEMGTNDFEEFIEEESGARAYWDNYGKYYEPPETEERRENDNE